MTGVRPVSRTRSTVLQAASVCLQYPDDALLRGAADRPDRRRRAARRRPAGTAGRVPRPRPTATPPVGPGASTTSRCSTPGAGAASTCPGGPTATPAAAAASLAALKARYRARGVELDSTELPDFLPVVLEFAATTDLAAGLELLQEYRAGVELLRLALLDAATPYAGAGRGRLRAAARPVAGRRRRGEGPRPQRPTARAGRARPRTVRHATPMPGHRDGTAGDR